MIKILHEPLPEADLFPYAVAFRCWACCVGFQLEPGDGHPWAQTAHTQGDTEFAVTVCPNEQCGMINILPKLVDCGWARPSATVAATLGLAAAAPAARPRRLPAPLDPPVRRLALDTEFDPDLPPPDLDDADPQPPRRGQRQVRDAAYEETIPRHVDWGDGVRVKR